MVALGIALLVTGAGLLIAEAHLPTFGALGIAGSLALVGGAAVAIDGAGGGTALIVIISLLLALVSAGFVLYVGHQALATMRIRPRTGADGLIGRVGVVRVGMSPLPQVFVDGALWRARPCLDSSETFDDGDAVVIERVQGLTLGVRRAEEWELDL